MNNPRDGLTPVYFTHCRSKGFTGYNWARVTAGDYINYKLSKKYPGYNISGTSSFNNFANSVQHPERINTSKDIRKFCFAHGVVNDKDISECLRQCYTSFICKSPWEKIEKASKKKRLLVLKNLKNEYGTYERNPNFQMKTSTLLSECTVHNMNSYTAPPLVTLFEIIDHKKILSHDQKKSVDERPKPFIRKHGCQWCGLRKSWNDDKLKLRYCSACNHVRYCSKMCQKLDWS
tara:strand:+ start:2248 stop:2946 length:699 start_codon:yes stop_codon:yes gene_type:complete